MLDAAHGPNVASGAQSRSTQGSSTPPASGTALRPTRAAHPLHACPPGKDRFQKEDYLISTVAPASVNFFLMVSASSLFTPSLIGLGAPSTRSLASFRPRLVTSRTALMTLILLAPIPVSTTENSVCSSAAAAGAAPPPPPAATTVVAAAAETPSASSSLFTRSAASRRVSPLICSTILSTFSDIVVFLLKNPAKPQAGKSAPSASSYRR